MILADSTRLSPEARHDGDVIDGGVRETVAVDLKLSDLRKVGTASHVDVALDIEDFSLNPHQIAALRDMASILSVPSQEADRIAFDILEAQKERRWRIEAEMEKAVAKARLAVKALPPRRRATEANKVGIAKMTQEFGPTYKKYGVTTEEYKDLLMAYPEFNESLPYGSK